MTLRATKPRSAKIPDTRALERALLGGFLTQPALLESVIVEPADFAFSAHREIYAVLRELADRGLGDLTLLLDAAETRGRTEAWGEVAALVGLETECVSVLLVPTYAQTLRDHR